MLAPSPFAVLDHSLMTMTMTSADDEERGPSPVQRLLTDRQELIALMVIRDETRVSITGRLQVPIRAIEGHAYRILEMLGLSTLGELTEESIERYRVGFDVRDKWTATGHPTVGEIALSMRVSKMTVYRLV